MVESQKREKGEILGVEPFGWRVKEEVRSNPD